MGVGFCFRWLFYDYYGKNEIGMGLFVKSFQIMIYIELNERDIGFRVCF